MTTTKIRVPRDEQAGRSQVVTTLDSGAPTLYGRNGSGQRMRSFPRPGPYLSNMVLMGSSGGCVSPAKLTKVSLSGYGGNDVAM